MSGSIVDSRCIVSLFGIWTKKSGYARLVPARSRCERR